MRTLRAALSGFAMAACVATGAAYAAEYYSWTKQQYALTEDYVREEMPAGFQVIVAELEGPVWADATGKTLYGWPLSPLRNGNAGELKGKPTCDDTHYRLNAGLQSPYPGGLELPEVDTRPSCVQVWPPVLASADAKPVGKWTVLDGPGGRKQWAYDGQALYTSILDKKPGDVFGATSAQEGGDGQGALRKPMGPERSMPSQFKVNVDHYGRMLTLANNFAVYVFDGDTANKFGCTGPCLETFAPVLAPERIRPQGDWTIVERSPGVKQWAYRGKPVYSYNLEEKRPSFEGSDEAGWHNVFTQLAPVFPKGFQITEGTAGSMLADAKGRTIYIYNCNDDAQDQLDCSHPSQPQAYRLAICGQGDWQRCAKTFQYVSAGAGEKSETNIWSIKHIDPSTGRWVEPTQAGAVRVWAYRDRPVYVCARDKVPGDYECDAWGEFSGQRNGWKAFWVREVFGRN
jgi:predicted lipoprotein with Yx(FWY)xxD motif